MKKATKLLCLLIIISFVLPICACGAPKLEEVKERFQTLIEASAPINRIFFGEGLPTYARNSDYAKEHRIYDDLESGYDFYEIVVTDEKWADVQSIKNAAEQVYSRDYLEGIYTMAFDGVADENTGDVTTARYLESGRFLLRYAYGETDTFDILRGKERRYLFDTMKIHRSSTSRYVNITIDSYLVGDEENVLSVRLRFVRQDGEWFLDSPTY